MSKDQRVIQTVKGPRRLPQTVAGGIGWVPDVYGVEAIVRGGNPKPTDEQKKANDDQCRLLKSAIRKDEGPC
jgi:hypothetical protein